MTTIKIVPGFKPSTSGFHFSNSFPNVPLLTINVLGQQIPIGAASNGMCGGMVFAARDFFEAGIPMWPDTTAPSSGPLFDYLVKRLFDSFDLILPPPPPPPLPPAPPFLPPFSTPIPPWGPGPSTYMWLMNIPNHETVASNAFFTPRGRAWIMINDQWPKIKEDIDNGRLSPIGLIEVDASIDPFRMGENHQVLAWGYKLDGPNLSDLTIHVYDPNLQNDDSVTMSLSIANPQVTTDVTYSDATVKVWCFFRPEYGFSSPPPPPPPPPPRPCFIATAACGADTIEVSVLRNFRDQCLLANSLGRALVALYERLSPPMAAIVARSPLLRAITRKLIVIPAYLIANRSLTRRSSRHR
jgi:hypothetical protein